jgi:hypothetical protein
VEALEAALTIRQAEVGGGVSDLMTLSERIERILIQLLTHAGVEARPGEVLAARDEHLALLEDANAR